MGKFYWCPKCQKFPDKIVEIYDWSKEIRKWDADSDCYEIVDDMHGDCHAECGECETQLEEKNV